MRTSKKPIELVVLGLFFFVFCQEGGQFCSDAHIRPKMDDSVGMSHQNMGQHLTLTIYGEWPKNLTMHLEHES